MDSLERAVTDVEFPSMRSDVVDALRSLADRGYQEREWGQFRADENRYDDLTLNVNVLYDDCRVLPDPASRIGTVLLASDVEPLTRLSDALTPLIAELGDSADSSYLADPRWDQVVEAARAALTQLESAS